MLTEPSYELLVQQLRMQQASAFADIMNTYTTDMAKNALERSLEQVRMERVVQDVRSMAQMPQLEFRQQFIKRLRVPLTSFGAPKFTAASATKRRRL
ncbi:hypothetical protein KDA23_05620 [Candidatus Saccharibacteria bacterium]|nr:hypothetical protein [Candidatus Saccharibacteria bacterium]